MGVKGINTFFSGGMFGFGSISTFETISTLCVLNYFKHFEIFFEAKCLKKQNKKKLHQVFMHKFLCQNMLIRPICIQ